MGKGKKEMKLKDLSGDGKVTQKDKLIGAGVLDKDGNKVKANFFNGGKVHASFGTDFDDR
tara:strand:+ start:604 stop:783 length:180 start_codon:yes stop_codon:yes gene_type:complete